MYVTELFTRLVGQVQSWYELLAIVATILVCIPKTWKYIYKFLESVWKIVQIVYLLPFRLSTILALLDEKTMAKIIAAANQLQPNGGSSLIDRVNQISLQLMLGEESRRATLAAIGHAFYEADKVGNVTFASKKLAEYMDLQTQEMLGNGWASALHPDDRDRVYRNWKSAVEQERMFVDTFRFLHNDGTIMYVQGQALPVLAGDAKQIVKYIGVLHLVKEERAERSRT